MRMFFPNTDLIDINIINFFIEVFGVVSIGFILFAGLRELRRLRRPGILNYNVTEKKEVLMFKPLTAKNVRGTMTRVLI